MTVTKKEFLETLEINESMMGECAAFEVTLEQLGIDHGDLAEILNQE